MGKHFISYSHRDGAKFAFRLRDELLVGEPSFEAWIDTQGLTPGNRWPGSLGDAIGDCETLLFVMTADSVDPQSVCGDECSRALRFKKPIVPLLFAPALTPPFLLETTQYIDFTDSMEKGLARLRLHLTWLDSPEGQLDQLRQRLRYAERDLRSASDGDRARIEHDIAQLKAEIDRQTLVAADPEKAAQKTQQTIAQGMERERQPAAPAAASGPRAKFINQPAATAPSHFQNRHVETKLLGDFLASGDGRMATVIGRGGTGKTAMVCRMLKSLETGELPDNLGPLPVDGIVYLSAAGSQRVDVARVFESLCKLLPDREVERLRAMAQDPQSGVDGLFTALLADFPSGRTVLLLDNFETLVADDGQKVRDIALGTALKTILEAPEHCLKVVITTRIAPNDLILTQPGRQWTIQLEKGLESPYAENVLRALDRDGTLGIRDADAAVLNRARERTRGFPRALEMLVGALKADRTMSLEEILDIAGQALPDSVVDVLVGEAFRRLDRPAQEIVEALSIFGLPVPATALDYLLQPFRPASNSEPVLKRLVNMEFVRYEKGRYFLHPVDSAFATGRIPAGEAADRAATPRWTRIALFARAADYYAQVRVPIDRRQSISDIGAELAEIDMRCAAGDYDGAAGVAMSIDQLLERWGYFRLRQSILARMTGRISDLWMRACHALSCSGASMRLGDLDAAIEQAQQAIDLATGEKNVLLQAWAQVALGNCVTETGQVDRAIGLLEDAIKLASAQQGFTPEQTLFARSLEHLALFNLSRCYIHLGNTTLALSYLRKAAEIATAIRDVDNQPLLFNNIANALGRLGQFKDAIDAANKGLDSARQLKSRLSECCNLTNLGMLQIDTGDIPGAIENLTHAVEIADDVFNRQFQDESREPLALAYLCTQNLDKAREIAEEALRYSAIQQNQPRSGLLAFLGIVALRQGDKEKARGWFRMAVDEAKEMLARNPKHFAVMEAQGLALSGLFACGDAADLTDATAAYAHARALTKDAGIVRRALRLFDALRAAVPGGDWEAARSVVAGNN